MINNTHSVFIFSTEFAGEIRGNESASRPADTNPKSRPAFTIEAGLNLSMLFTNRSDIENNLRIGFGAYVGLRIYGSSQLSSKIMVGFERKGPHQNIYELDRTGKIVGATGDFTGNFNCLVVNTLASSLIGRKIKFATR